MVLLKDFVDFPSLRCCCSDKVKPSYAEKENVIFDRDTLYAPVRVELLRVSGISPV